MSKDDCADACAAHSAIIAAAQPLRTNQGAIGSGIFTRSTGPRAINCPEVCSTRNDRQRPGGGIPAALCPHRSARGGAPADLQLARSDTFRQRDIDPRAEEFIAGWAREISSDKPLGLLIHVDNKADATADKLAVVRVAVRDYFAERAAVTRQQLRLLFRRGRTSLVIGLVFLAGSIVSGNIAADMLEGTGFADIARESLLIGGWVAMWRPLEVFLYDWWPIRAEARLYDRLSAMTVRVVPSRST
jgi:hypothetical protein